MQVACSGFDMYYNIENTCVMGFFSSIDMTFPVIYNLTRLRVFRFGQKSYSFEHTPFFDTIYLVFAYLDPRFSELLNDQKINAILFIKSKYSNSSILLTRWDRPI